jgi:hypothetical protein
MADKRQKKAAAKKAAPKKQTPNPTPAAPAKKRRELPENHPSFIPPKVELRVGMIEDLELPKGTKVRPEIEDMKQLLLRHAAHLPIKKKALIINGKNKSTAAKFLKDTFPQHAFTFLYTDKDKTFCRIWRVK